MRNKISSKEAIIATGEKIIMEEGLAKCSIRRIAKELSLAVGTIYNYYPSREELLLQVFHVSWEKSFT